MSAQTPFTGSTSYATPSDMIVRYDVRTLGDLLSDDNVSGRLSPTEVLNSTTLQLLLNEASGDVEQALVAGKRYSPTDLNALVTNGGNGKETLVGLVCGLTLGKLMDRRPDRLDPPKSVVRAEEKLQLLRGGDRVLPFEEAAEAGVEVPVITPPTTNQCLITQKAWNYFGPIVRPNDGGCGRNGCGCDR